MRARRRWTAAGIALAGAAKLASRSATSPATPVTARSARPAESRRPRDRDPVVETAEQLLDQRHLDAGKLATLLARAQEFSRGFAEEERIDVAWERIWSIEPILFDETLIGLADEAIREVAGTSYGSSGPLHDAAEVSRRRPDRDAFVQSLRGLSHTKLEDTKAEHPELGRRPRPVVARRRSTGSPLDEVRAGGRDRAAAGGGLRLSRGSDPPPDWQADDEEVRDAPGGPLSAGATFTEVRSFLGKRAVSTSRSLPRSRVASLLLGTVSGPVEARSATCSSLRGRDASGSRPRRMPGRPRPRRPLCAGRPSGGTFRLRPTESLLEGS
jgi:hypothetical protein